MQRCAAGCDWDLEETRASKPPIKTMVYEELGGLSLIQTRMSAMQTA